MNDLMTAMDRLVEMTELLLAMCKETDDERLWELSKRFDDLKEVYKLEDEINDGRDLADQHPRHPEDV